MSAVKCNLLNSRPVPARRAAARNNHADAEEKTSYERDVFRRVGVKDVCRLARQLATLLHAGMPLVPALSVLVEQLQEVSKHTGFHLRTHNYSLAEIVEEVRNSVNAGSTLADALNKHPNVFSGLFVNMIAAGEASGNLEEILLRLAEMLEKRVNLAGKVKSAVAYPLMMIVTAVAVVVFLLSFVVPGITGIFVEMNRVLPWPTRLLISTSYFMRTYLVLIVVVLCAVFFGIGAGCRTREGRLLADRSKLKLPLFGGLFLKLEIARLTRTLGILLAGGIPVLGALEIARGVVQNSFIAEALSSVKDRVSKGDNIAGAMRKTGLFPPIVFHIVATSQVSGNIEAGLMDIADMYDGEVEMTAKTLVSLLEPAILLVMGVIVGFIVLAILLPIFEISQVL